MNRAKFLLAGLTSLFLAGCAEEKKTETVCPLGHKQAPVYIHFHNAGIDGAACSQCGVVYIPGLNGSNSVE